MINPILYAGIKIDNALMKGVDYSIKGYNWAMGGTKADLANALLCVLPGSMIIKGIQNSDYPLIVGSIITGICGYKISQDNKIQEKLEEDGLNKNCKDMKVEQSKIINKIFGYSLFGVAGYVKTNDSILLDPIRYLSAGYFAGGWACNVMSSDENPPRRDNCLKRAYDNLKREPAHVQKNSLESLV
jgi:hypothetical protein